METLDKLIGITGILINTFPTKSIRDSLKANKIIIDAEKDYFKKELTEKERETKYEDIDFRKLVKENLEKAKLGNYYNLDKK